jgi:hypothetical protein
VEEVEAEQQEPLLQVVEALLATPQVLPGAEAGAFFVLRRQARDGACERRGGATKKFFVPQGQPAKKVED